VRKCISAICVSHASRFGLLQRAIVSFARQTHTDRELLIVINQPGYLDTIRGFLADPRYEKFLEELEVPKEPIVRVVHTNFRYPSEAVVYGAARAEGNYIACWDDDNLSHPERMAMQVERTTRNKPTVLSESLYYFYDSDELFLTDYAQPSGAASSRCAVGSLMFTRNHLPNLIGGDRRPWTLTMMDVLAKKHNYQFIAGMQHMFMVGSNGNNWREVDLHRKLGSRLPGTKKRDQLLEMQGEIEEWLKGYHFPDDEVDVCGSDAQAFVVSEAQKWPNWMYTTEMPSHWKHRIPNEDHQQRTNAERQKSQKANK